MYSIENDYLRVEVNALGAEMSRLYDCQTNEDRLWDAKPSIWGKHAPVLFPFVGASKNGEYLYGGTSYAMSRHGFAREMMFQVVEHTAASICLELRATSITLLKYPFQFTFQVTYSLAGSTLTTTYTVKNEDSKELIFSVGGHPAFHCDYLQGDCFIAFETEETLETIKIDLTSGLLKRQKEPVVLENKRLKLDAETFKDDALVFENLKSTWVKLIDTSYTKAIKVTIDAFPSLGIWSPIAPFVCIEPWQGTADYEDATGKLEEKVGTVTLMPSEVYTKNFMITLEV